MGKRLVRKRQAERDLAEQVDYIGQDRPAAARRYLIAVERAFARLREMPELGVLRPFGARALHAARVWPVPGFRRFLIIYRVTPGAVEVIRVLHSARDVAGVLKRASRT